MKEFSPQIFEDLGSYVYALKDPRTDSIFYIGKGSGNRAFQHKEDSLISHLETDKLNRIREIEESGNQLQYLIIRHGLTEDEAYKIESTLINVFGYLNHQLTNLMSGHDTQELGIKTSNEIHRLYNPQTLEKLEHSVVIININKAYKKGRFIDDVYEAVKEAWVISEKRLNTIEYVLAEYKGRIVGVFKVKEWYQYKSQVGKLNRYGFVKDQNIEQSVVEIYLNKSIQKYKKRGQANPITYKL
jgi:hypothetical protein